MDYLEEMKAISRAIRETIAHLEQSSEVEFGLASMVTQLLFMEETAHRFIAQNQEGCALLFTGTLERTRGDVWELVDGTIPLSFECIVINTFCVSKIYDSSSLDDLELGEDVTWGSDPFDIMMVLCYLKPDSRDEEEVTIQ